MDDNQANFAKDTTTHIIELLKSNFGEYFKTYFEATPTTPPPATDFPLIIVQKLGGPIVLGPTQADELRETIQITIMLNRADDIGSANVRTTTMRHLQNIVEGQDPITNQYKKDTIAYVLRTYLTLEQWVINSDVNIRYDIIPKKEASLCMADVTLSIWRRVMVANRQ